MKEVFLVVLGFWLLWVGYLIGQLFELRHCKKRVDKIIKICEDQREIIKKSIGLIRELQERLNEYEDEADWWKEEQ